MKYIELTIHEKINYKSGWDIAIVYEGQKRGISNRPYCKLAKCIEAKSVSLKICQQDYNDCQRHRFLNGGRVFVKQSF